MRIVLDTNCLIQSVFDLIYFNAEAQRREDFEVLEERSALQLTLTCEFADNHSATRGCDYGGRRGQAWEGIMDNGQWIMYNV